MKRNHVLIAVLTVAFWFIEVTKQILLTVHNGFYDVWYFPFQLCSMPLYLLPAYLFFRRKKDERRKIVAAFLMDYGVLGGIMVFFDQSGLHYEIPLLTFFSYLWHVLMIVTGILLYLEEGCLSINDYHKASVLYLILVVLAEGFNVLLHPFGAVDMFYVSPYRKMGQIVFREIGNVLGSWPARVIYVLSTMAGAYLLHILYPKQKRR